MNRSSSSCCSIIDDHDSRWRMGGGSWVRGGMVRPPVARPGRAPDKIRRGAYQEGPTAYRQPGQTKRRRGRGEAPADIFSLRAKKNEIRASPAGQAGRPLPAESGGNMPPDMPRPRGPEGGAVFLVRTACPDRDWTRRARAHKRDRSPPAPARLVRKGREETKHKEGRWRRGRGTRTSRGKR